MRHAKSSWGAEDLTDHQRPLNDRGRRAAPLIGNALKAKAITPDIIWSSDSVRTRETARRAFPDHSNTTFINKFYLASANQVLYQCQILAEAETHDGDPSQDREPNGRVLLLLGHNPGWEELVWLFSGRSYRMPTAACAVFTRAAEDKPWLDPESWRLRELIYPRDLQ